MSDECNVCKKPMTEHRRIPKGGELVVYECPPLRPLAEGDAELTGDWRGWDPKEKQRAQAYTKRIRKITGDPEA